MNNFLHQKDYDEVKEWLLPLSNEIKSLFGLMDSHFSNEDESFILFKNGGAELTQGTSIVLEKEGDWRMMTSYDCSTLYESLREFQNRNPLLFITEISSIQEKCRRIFNNFNDHDISDDKNMPSIFEHFDFFKNKRTALAYQVYIIIFCLSVIIAFPFIFIEYKLSLINNLSICQISYHLYSWGLPVILTIFMALVSMEKFYYVVNNIYYKIRLLTFKIKSKFKRIINKHIILLYFSTLISLLIYGLIISIIKSL